MMTRFIVGKVLKIKKRTFNSFLEDVQLLKGNDRVWFIFSDIVDCGGCSGDMQVFYADLLDQSGTRLDQFHGIGADAFL